MRALATRPQRLALGIAVLSAAALGTVTASAAQASDTATAKSPRTVESGVSVVQEKGNGKGAPKHLDPPKGAAFAVAYHPTANAPGDLNTANGDFAKCMRAQGQSVFPRVHASKDADGHINLQVLMTGGDFDPTTAGYKKAVKVCGPILEKAGLTFPNPADLPPLPTPDKPGKPGKVTSELPSLTRAFAHT
ncbi:hypothetical protein ACFWP5_32135 [Streptomyces sp. NPDC058469]|uniref:hypothetical protein n=1 Tax=Streptomyces sp. NPDC058469 TaxID=3346514 RepID=UPI003659A00C